MRIVVRDLNGDDKRAAVGTVREELEPLLPMCEALCVLTLEFGNGEDEAVREKTVEIVKAARRMLQADGKSVRIIVQKTRIPDGVGEVMQLNEAWCGNEPG